MLSRLVTAALFISFMLAAAPAGAQGHTIRQGVLTCRTSASIGLIVGSRQRLRCQFRSDRGLTQNYFGAINRLGLDLGVTAGGVMVWAVLASTPTIPPGALTGRFVGASGDVAVGVGVGANVLIGGTSRSVSLQPLSVEGQVGVNLALGVAAMTLSPVR
jgi:Protein of unknown function (DUF992)